MIERQELWCHNCSHYVQFDMDLSLNGDHVLECPNCGHEHCRVVENGQITEVRWGQRNGRGLGIIRISTFSATVSRISTWDTYTVGAATTSCVFLYGSWMDAASGS
jgi:DNA-directed RNA polymerase subunit RPC12/RpoP